MILLNDYYEKEQNINFYYHHKINFNLVFIFTLFKYKILLTVYFHF